jgi:hypothetical protein
MPEAWDSFLFFPEFLALQSFQAVRDEIHPQGIKAAPWFFVRPKRVRCLLLHLWSIVFGLRPSRNSGLVLGILSRYAVVVPVHDHLVEGEWRRAALDTKYQPARRAVRCCPR